jgi:hypothetical protein
MTGDDIIFAAEYPLHDCCECVAARFRYNEARKLEKAADELLAALADTASPFKKGDTIEYLGRDHRVLAVRIGREGDIQLKVARQNKDGTLYVHPRANSGASEKWVRCCKTPKGYRFS